MSVGQKHAERIAILARLHFGAEEIERLTEELNHILQLVEALRILEDGPAVVHSEEGAPQAWQRGSTRGSEAEVPDTLDQGLNKVSPDWAEGFFVVPPQPGLHKDEGA